MRSLNVKEKFYGVVAVFVLWTLLYAFIGAQIVPAPWIVIQTFMNLILNGKLGLHLLHSLYRITCGIALAVIVGVPLGLVTGMRVKVHKFISPIIYLLYPIPKIAFLPILMVLFGLGDLSKVILIFTIIVFQVFISTRDSVKEIPREFHYVTRSLKLDKMQIYKDLILPSAMPKIFSAIRVSLGISISVLFFGENYATTYGIGYFIMNSWIMVNYEQMFAGILALSFMGIILFQCLDLLERKCCKWMFIESKSQ